MTETHPPSFPYVLLFGGITSLVLGILLFTQTTASLAIIMLPVSLVWFILGLFSILSVFFDRSRWGWKLFGGVIGITAGVLAFGNPVVSTAVVPAVVTILLGVCGVLLGISALVAAFPGERLGAGTFGAISLFLGLLLFFNPLVGGQDLVWVVAVLLVVQGILGIFWSFIWGFIWSLKPNS